MSLLLSFLLKLLSVVISLIVVVVTVIKWKHQYWANRAIPFFPPRVPFGNLQNPRRKKYSIGFHIKNFYDQAKKMGWKHCGLYFFASPVYLVVDLDYLKHIMSTDFQYFVDRGMYYNEKIDPISAHLFALGGTRWKNLRSKLSPTFTSTKMKMMFPTLVECVSLLLDAMVEKSVQIDIKELLGRFTTDIIGSCAFGLDCNTIKEENSPFRHYGKKVFFSTKLRTLKLTFASSFPTLGRLLRIRQVSSDVSDFFRKIVKDTIEYREENQFSRPDFLQMLIDLRKEGAEISLDEVIAQCFIFFLAGFETSSTTMTFALYELAKNHQIQDKLRDEIVQVLRKYNDEITYEGITEMKYLDQVIEESLRKYPPLPFVTRTCVMDYKVPHSDLIIEKGRRVILPILALHHDPQFWPEPQNFDPERFNDQNKSLRQQYSYIPFGEGPRFCIGKKFGLTQTKVGLVALIKNYEFSVNSKTTNPLKMAANTFILSAEGGIWLDSKKL
ncbi:probable cytochrome P450 6a23 [Tribolium madens]|uniref:probable cytochrome P450 6a23 n=1 Tax=Tribolium madens TaxID=41895 RepID=UPI001CF7210F|nr:probable cytochrome P450 6a23 [Tribolium madens]